MCLSHLVAAVKRVRLLDILIANCPTTYHARLLDQSQCQVAKHASETQPVEPDLNESIKANSIQHCPFSISLDLLCC